MPSPAANGREVVEEVEEEVVEEEETREVRQDKLC